MRRSRIPASNDHCSPGLMNIPIHNSAVYPQLCSRIHKEDCCVAQRDGIEHSKTKRHQQ